MVDLASYKDLSRTPDMNAGPATGDPQGEENLSRNNNYELATVAGYGASSHGSADISALSSNGAGDLEASFSTNVTTLIRLVGDLPEGVTKQTGAQIIRLTMEAMGISMEEVLSEAQAAQSDMLDAVRANIKKIEEFKTVIRKLESDIKFYQGKANELSEIIDLFILSNSSSNRNGEESYLEE